MRRRATALLALLALLPVCAEPDIPGLVAKLGADDWQVREEATSALIDAGDAALPALREAARSSDPEVRMRASTALDAIDSGLSSKGYERFGNVREAWRDLDRNERREMFVRMSAELPAPERARVFAKLALEEEDDDSRSMLIENALASDGPRAMAVFGARMDAMDPKKDAALAVKVASWYNANGQADKGLAILDRIPGPMELPLALAHEVSNVYASNRNWKRAADAFGALADRVPQPDETEAAGIRAAYLKLAGEDRAFEAALDVAARADADSRNVVFGATLLKLETAGLVQGALEVVARGADAGCAGDFAIHSGRLLLSRGRDAEAHFMFRRALMGQESESVVEAYAEMIREACAATGELTLATREFALELKHPEKSAAAHAAAARVLSDSGFPGAAAAEWRRAAALAPGSLTAAAETARALAACGDPRAARWRATVLATAGPGSVEAAIAELPVQGRASSPVVRRAVDADFQGAPSFHATCGDVAATADMGRRELVGFDPSGRVLWKWRWAEPPRTIEGRFSRVRTWEFADLVALPDAFLLVVRENDTVTRDFDSESGWAGAWLAVVDAASGVTRSLARAEGGVCDPTRASIALGGRLFVASEDLSVLVATDVDTARTAWIRPLHRASSATDPSRVEVLPRLAALDGLVFVPSPHGRSVLALRATDGSTAWEAAVPGAAVDLALDGGDLWACAGQSLVRIEATTGRVLHTINLEATVIGAPARIGDVLAVRTRDGLLRGLAAGTPFAERWRLFVGPAARLETVVATDGAFFLCRRDSRDTLPSWAVAPDGRPLRRLYLRFTFPPGNWRGRLLVDDLFGRRQAFCLPAGGDDFSPLLPSGLLLIDGAALASGDGARIAALAKDRTPEVSAALTGAALALDPENPDALALRVRSSPPVDTLDPGAVGGLRADAWRALDAFPPLDPGRAEAVKAVEAALKIELPLAVRFERDTLPWVAELRLFNALQRLARSPGDHDATAAIADSGLRAAAAFLPEAAAVARLRCGDLTALPAVVRELEAPAGLQRMEAAEALAWCSDPSAAEALRGHLGENEPVRVRLSAALASGGADPAALEVLEKFGLPADEDPVFLRAASILLAAGRPRAVDALANPANYRRSAGSWDSPLAMLAAAPGDSGPARLEALVAGGGESALAAARALMTRDRPRAMRALAAALEKTPPRGDNERWLLQMISSSEVPAIAPLYAERAKASLGGLDDISWPALFHMIAESLDACGRGAEARKHLDAYGAILPDTAETNNNTAWFLSISRSPEMHDGAAALPRAMRAVAAEPWNSGYWDTLAEAFFAAGLPHEAVHVAAFALALAPADGEPYSEPYYEKQLAKMLARRAAAGPR